MYFYTNASNDAPKLKNRYGDLNKVINYLIDGGAEYTVSKIEPNAAKVNTVKVYFTADLSPFVQYQTVVVSGSLVSQYNTDMFIESVNPVEKYYVCYKSTFDDSLGLDNNVNMKLKIKTTGIERKFGGVEQSRTVIKFNGGIEYRIDDRDFRPLVNPPVVPDEYNENWLKCARVTMAESFNSLDSATTRYFPYNPDRPLVNFQPQDNYIGTGAWIQYNRTDTIYYINQSTDDISNVEMNWKIFADDETLILITNSSGAYYKSDKYVYILGNYERNNTNRINGMLFCFGENINTIYGYDSSSTFTSHYANSVPRNFLSTYSGADQNYYTGHVVSIVYDNGEGGVGNVARFPEFTMSPTISGYNDGFSLRNVNSFDSGIYFCDVLFAQPQNSGAIGYEIYGKARNMKWVSTALMSNIQSVSDGKIFMIDGEMYYSYAHSTSASSASTNLIKLTRK